MTVCKGDSWEVYLLACISPGWNDMFPLQLTKLHYYSQNMAATIVLSCSVQQHHMSMVCYTVVCQTLLSVIDDIFPLGICTTCFSAGSGNSQNGIVIQKRWLLEHFLSVFLHTGTTYRWSCYTVVTNSAYLKVVMNESDQFVCTKTQTLLRIWNTPKNMEHITQSAITLHRVF